MAVGSNFEHGGHSKQTLNGGEVCGHWMTREHTPSRGNSRCGGPKAGVCLVCSRNSRSAVCEGERSTRDDRGTGVGWWRPTDHY